MDDVLTKYLAAHPWHHETTERWPIQGSLRLRLALATHLPPLLVSSSILAVVFNCHSQVLFLWPTERSGSIAHILIGGRSQPGETPNATVVRELGEETGWRVKPGCMVGYRHFFHLEAQQEKSDRPYPDFIQPIYSALAVEYDKRLIVPGDQSEADFISFADAERSIDAPQRPILHAALDDLRLGIW